MANTIPNRMYLLAATSFGHVFPDNPPPGGFSPQTIFAALTKAGVSWRYYYLDNSVFLAQFKDYQSNPIIAGNVYPIQDYYNILQGMCSGQPCDPDQALPQVIFIERAGSTGLDEHPDTGSNNQKGAAVVQQIVEALMNSTAWSDSAFILTFDEAGGFYDHVPPIQVPLPDNYAPVSVRIRATARSVRAIRRLLSILRIAIAVDRDLAMGEATLRFAYAARHDGNPGLHRRDV